MALAPEVAAEYSSLTEGGSAAGSGTLRQAEANVASRKAASQAAAAKAPSQQSGGQGQSSTQRDPVTGGTNLDPLGLKRPAARALGSVSTPSATAQTVTKLIWAVAIGLIVLEIASQATGQYWGFNLQGPPIKKQPYQPLYGAMPGMLGGTPGATPGLKLVPGTGGQ